MTKVFVPTPSEIREAREGLGLSHAQFAQLMGYGQRSRVYEIEKGPERGGRMLSGPAINLFRLVTGKTTIASELKKVRLAQK